MNGAALDCGFTRAGLPLSAGRVLPLQATLNNKMPHLLRD
ncbi:hypothetical protein R75777_02053 [Paraburkholderia nemoris]|jgi:hypothetical protein|nr:hypothetical protein LMG22931_01385 [Paraburkholderia nemoris]CAE6730763.1 hypothetical protein R75777_02053 [Paraburkholderia nemoris]